MRKLLILCLMLVALSSLLMGACGINNYKPISIRYQNFDYVPYSDGESKTFLIDLLNNSKWHNDVAKCECDYSIIMKNQREIFYHSECGTFIDYDFDKSLTISEEDRVKLNGYFADAMHFIRNQAGATWLNDITVDEIFEIKMIWGGGGPLPPVSFTNISSSRDRAVISSIFEEYYWLDSTPVAEEITQIPDGGYVIVQFILNDGTVKKLSFINGDFYYDGTGNYFEIARLPVFRDGTNFVNRYGFETSGNYCQIYLIDETFVCEIPVSELEFVELTDDIYLGNSAPTRYIEISGEKLYFIKDCYFYIGDDRSVYYQLVQKNLDQLIAEYTVE